MFEMLSSLAGDADAGHHAFLVVDGEGWAAKNNSINVNAIIFSRSIRAS
jgi:hypothetical protein